MSGSIPTHLDAYELQLVRDEDHYLYDKARLEEPLNEGMIRNIMKNGVIEPIVVTKENGKYVVVAGRRRLLHLREANTRLIEEGKRAIKAPITLRSGEQKDLYGVYISENTHRKDESMMNKARKVAKLMGIGASQEEAAIDFGVTKRSIQSWLRLLELDPRVITMIDQDELSATLALERRFHELSHEEQYELAKLIIAGKDPMNKKERSESDPDAIRPPRKNLVMRLIESKQDTLSRDFLRGVEWARGFIDEYEAGIHEILQDMRRNPVKRKK